MNTKGIILAGGKATRLYPITKSVCKQLLPVYDKPMVYYPLSVLMLGGIKEILVIISPEDEGPFRKCLGDGSQLGISIAYAHQTEPRGLAEAFIIGEKFIGEDKVCLILGDNIFYGEGIPAIMQKCMKQPGGTIFAYPVKDPQRYGVITFDMQRKVLSIEEKPQDPKSHWAMTGLYLLDHHACGFAKKIKPSARGELEITDVINMYLTKGMLNVVTLGRGYAWLDTGTYESLIDAAIFIKTIEDRQGLKIGCIEEVAFLKGFISREQLLALAQGYKTTYAQYLHKVACEGE